MRGRIWGPAAIAAALALGLTACGGMESGRGDSGRTDETNTWTDDMREAGDTVRDGLSDAGKGIRDGLSDTGNSIRDAWDEGTDSVRDAWENRTGNAVGSPTPTPANELEARAYRALEGTGDVPNHDGGSSG